MLIDPTKYEWNIEENNWIPLASRKSLSIIRIIGICASMLSYQVAYSIEFALGMPIMGKIGISTTISGFIWAIGPLSGFIVQPLIGYYSDIFRFNYGRRRIFILIGTIGVLIGFFLLNKLESFSNFFNIDSKTSKTIIIFISFLFINISLNILQGPARALVGDLVPKSQQVLANIIGSTLISFGATITNFLGSLRLSKRLNYQIADNEILLIIGSILIILSVFFTLISSKEEPLTEAPARDNPFIEIYQAWKKMPKSVSKISLVYLFSWMAYFPFQISATDFFGHVIFKGDPIKEDEIYKEGVAFGMMVIAISHLFVLIFGIFNNSIITILGMKFSYQLSQIIATISLFSIFLFRNKWILLIFLAPLGISVLIFNSIPFAIIGMSVPFEQMGVYMGVLNTYAVVGQQLSNFLLFSGLSFFIPSKSILIASGSIFALISAFLCKKIEIPSNSISIESLLPKSQTDPIK